MREKERDGELERDEEKDRRCAKVREKDGGRRGRQIGCLTSVGPCSVGSPACTVHPVVPNIRAALFKWYTRVTL